MENGFSPAHAFHFLMPDSEDITLWLRRLQAGDDRAADALFELYFPRLVGLARRLLKDLPRRIADEEDVALSALHSFLRGVDAGRFRRLDDRHGLWKLLVTVAARKASHQQRAQLAQKRGGGDVRGESVFAQRATDVDAVGFEGLSDERPSPELEVALADACQELIARLEDDRLRSIALLKMEGYTNDEISRQLDITTRTLERKLNLIRQIWSAEATDS